MKAVLIEETTGLDAIRVADVPGPAAGPGDVVIEVHSASVNFPDVLLAEGAYQIKPALPFTPGMDAAGRVVEVGADVTRFKIGDRVFASVEYGAFAERLAAPADRCFPVPDKVGIDVAAAAGLAYQTAYFALVERGALKPDDVLVINGANGGVGLACIRLAKALGTVNVIGCVANAAKADAVRAAGADHVIVTERPDLLDGMRKDVRGLTGGHGADLVIDLVGGDVFDASLRTLAFRGRLVTVGFASGRIPAVKANYLLLKNISVVGLQWAAYPENVPEEVREAQRKIFDLFAQGRLDPNIGAVHPLEEAREALRAMKERRLLGKILIAVREEEWS